MLKGQAKKDYQRRYMREHRPRKQDVRPPVRPIVQPRYIVRPELVMPEPSDVPSVTTTNAVGWVDADGNPVYDAT